MNRRWLVRVRLLCLVSMLVCAPTSARGEFPTFSPDGYCFKVGCVNGYTVRWNTSATVEWRLNETSRPPELSGEPMDDIQAAFDSAFDAWEAASSHAVSFHRAGTTSQTAPNDDDGEHRVFWVNTDYWFDDDGEIAVTIVDESPYGEILDCETLLLNLIDDEFEWGLDECADAHLPLVPLDVWDLEGVMTHEVGHWVFLDDLEQTKLPDGWTSVMAKPVQPSESMAQLRNLSAELDVAGTQWVYANESCEDTGPCDCSGMRDEDMSWACIKYCFAGCQGVVGTDGEDDPWHVIGFDKSYLLAWDDFGGDERQEYKIFRSSGSAEAFEEITPSRSGQRLPAWDNVAIDYDVLPRETYVYIVASSPDGERIDEFLTPPRSAVAHVVDGLEFFDGELLSQPLSLVLCDGDLVYQFVLSFPDSGVVEHAIRVVDAAVPGALQEVSSLDISAAISDSSPGPMDIGLRGKLLFVSTNQSIAILDVSDPASPGLLSTIGPPPSGAYERIFPARNHLYVCGYQYMQTWDVSDVYAPEYVAGAPLPPLCATDNFIVEGDLLFTQGCICDVSDPASIQLIGEYWQDFAEVPGNRAVCAFDGGFLYTTIGIVDARVPSAPAAVETLDHMLDEEDWSITSYPDIKGNYLVVPGTAFGYDLVELFDVSNPYQSTLAGVFQVPSTYYESVVSVGSDYMAAVGRTAGGAATVWAVLDDQPFTFRVTGSDGFVSAQWRVHDPSILDGFNLLRGASYDGPYEQLNGGLITPSSQYTSDGGLSYSYTDDEVVRGTTYVYRLQGVRADTTDIRQTDCATPYMCNPFCRFVAPQGGELLLAGELKVDIEWVSVDEGPISYVALGYQLDETGPFRKFAITDDDGQYTWWPDLGLTGLHTCRLRLNVYDEDGNIGSVTTPLLYMRLGTDPAVLNQEGPFLLCPYGDAEAPAIIVTVLDAEGDPVEGKQPDDIWAEVTPSAAASNFSFACSDSPYLLRPDAPTDQDGKTLIDLSKAAGSDPDADIKVWIRDGSVEYWSAVSLAAKSPDLSGDGVIGAQDWTLYVQAYGQAGAWLPADLNFDGLVGAQDMTLMMAHYGHDCASGRTLPVPKHLLVAVGLPAAEDVGSLDEREESIPLSYELTQNRPNPFNPSTLLSYSVPEPGGPVCLEIFDPGGRLVITLIDREESPGRYTIRWDGRDSLGHPLASGVYFCRMRAADYVDVTKLVLVR